MTVPQIYCFQSNINFQINETYNTTMKTVKKFLNFFTLSTCSYVEDKDAVRQQIPMAVVMYFRQSTNRERYLIKRELEISG